MANSQILDSVYNIADKIFSFIPILIAVIVLIIVGWILGRTIGKVVAKVLDRIGLNDVVDKTALGDMIKKGGATTVGVFEAIIRWFIYLIFAVIIVDLLKIQIVADFVAWIILFIPLIVSALIVLIIGLLLVDFLAGLIKKVLIATGLDDKVLKGSVGEALKAGGATPSGIIAGIVKLFGYLIFIMAAAEILQFTIVSEFLRGAINYLPHLFVAVVILIVGFLAIDFFADYIQSTMKGMNVEGADIWLPALRGFLFLVVILLALDALLINTSIFYIFLGPLAWGFAIVVAFKWGIKEAIVAYAEAKK